MMIKGHPCKCIEISTSKTGKHGHAKAHIVALDIFTSKKYEDLCPASHNVEVPFVKKIEYQILTADAETGEPTDEDKKISKEIVALVDKGEKTVMVTVQAACGMEKIIAVKETQK